jgi:hypothetical protein
MAKSKQEQNTVEAVNLNTGEITEVVIPAAFGNVQSLPELETYKNVEISGLNHVQSKNGQPLPNGGYYEVTFKDQNQRYRFFPNKANTPADKEGTFDFNCRVLREKAGVRTIPELIGKTISMYYGINTGRSDQRVEWQLFKPNTTSNAMPSIEGAI